MSQALVTLDDKIANAEKALAVLVLHCDKQSKGQQREKMREKMKTAFELFQRLTSGLGRTEYDNDGGYTGEEVLDKYSRAVADSWNGRAEHKDAVKAITTKEIEAGVDAMEQRRAELQSRRIMAIESAKQIKQLAIEQSGEEDPEDHDVEDVVAQALHNKPLKGRPKVIQQEYTSMFGGPPIKRNINPKAISGPTRDSREYLEDYHGRQLEILQGDSDDETDASSRVSANAERAKAEAQRRKALQDARNKKAKEKISRAQTKSDDEDEGDD